MRAVASITTISNLVLRLEVRSKEVQALQRAIGLIESETRDKEEIAAVGQGVKGALGLVGGVDIAAGFLSIALTGLIGKGRYDDALVWIERLDQWFPEDRQGLFATFAIAAKHLRGRKEDARILDQQPPEVRAVVEAIGQAALAKRSS